MISNIFVTHRWVVKKASYVFVLALVVLLAFGCTSAIPIPTTTPKISQSQAVKLPEPRLRGEISLEETLLKRRSVRDYAVEPLRLEEISQLLWAAQGVTAEWGGRTAPSAGALYPLEVYLVVGNVENLSRGVYRYNPERHKLVKVKNEDVREQLEAAALGQSCVRDGAISIVITAVYERTTGKYGDRGMRYVHMEAGHAAQNIYLQATALNLGTVTVGAFRDDQVRDILGLSQNETPLYVIPVGRKKG